jgi:hypothetical protein
MHEVSCRLVAPPELAIQKHQPLAVFNAIMDLGQPPANLNHVGDNVARQHTDRLGVLSDD